MKPGLSRAIVISYGLYNLIFGLIAISHPFVISMLYSANPPTPEHSWIIRWLGAALMPMVYASFVATRTGNKDMLILIIIGAVTTDIANVLGITLNGIGWARLGVDIVFQMVTIIALLTSTKNKDHNFKINLSR